MVADEKADRHLGHNTGVHRWQDVLFVRCKGVGEVDLLCQDSKRSELKND